MEFLKCKLIYEIWRGVLVTGSHSNYFYSASSCPQMRLRIASYYGIDTRYSIRTRLVLMRRLTVQCDKIVVNKIRYNARLKIQDACRCRRLRLPASSPRHRRGALGPPSQLLQFMDSKRGRTLTAYKFPFRLDIV